MVNTSMWKNAKIYLRVLYIKAKGPVTDAISVGLAFSWGPYLAFKYNLLLFKDELLSITVSKIFLIGVMSVVASIVIDYIVKEIYRGLQKFFISVKKEAERNKLEQKRQASHQSLLREREDESLMTIRSQRDVHANSLRLDTQAHTSSFRPSNISVIYPKIKSKSKSKPKPKEIHFRPNRLESVD